METISAKQQFLKLARQICPGFIIDEYNRQVIADLFSYFTGQSGKLDPKRGIWLEGPIGTGKTTLLYIFSQYLKILNARTFLLHNTSDVVMQYTVGKNLYAYTTGLQCIPSHPVNTAFDELGREPVPAYRYGNALNVMQYILNIRYTLWQQQGIITHITTNLDAEETEAIYGEFIRDRRCHQFNIIPLLGPSRRN